MFEWTCIWINCLNMSSISLLASLVSDEKLAVTLLEFACKLSNQFSLVAFKIFSVLYHSTRMCLGVDLFEFILLGIHWASWICRLRFFIKFGKFSALISLNIFPAHFFLLAWHSTYVYAGALNGVLNVSLKLYSFFIIFFLYTSDFMIFISLFSLTVLLVQINCWAPFREFFICYCTFNSRVSFL